MSGTSINTSNKFRIKDESFWAKIEHEYKSYIATLSDKERANPEKEIREEFFKQFIKSKELHSYDPGLYALDEKDIPRSKKTLDILRGDYDDSPTPAGNTSRDLVDLLCNIVFHKRYYQCFIEGLIPEHTREDVRIFEKLLVGKRRKIKFEDYERLHTKVTETYSQENENLSITSEVETSDKDNKESTLKDVKIPDFNQNFEQQNASTIEANAKSNPDIEVFDKGNEQPIVNEKPKYKIWNWIGLIVIVILSGFIGHFITGRSSVEKKIEPIKKEAASNHTVMPNDFVSQIIKDSGNTLQKNYLILKDLNFNTLKTDVATLIVSISNGPWKMSVDASLGDTVIAQLFYHNTSKNNILATHTRLHLYPPISNADSNATLIGYVQSDYFPAIGNLAIVRFTSPSMNLYYLGNSVHWFADNNFKQIKTLPFRQNGDEIFTSAGLDIGDVAPGISGQGCITIQFLARN